MRLDQPRDDPYVGVDETTVEPDNGRSGRRAAEVDVVFVPAGEVVDHSDVVDDPRVADQFTQFITLVGAMQPRRHQDRDPFDRNTRLAQPVDDRAEQQTVGDGPGDVADRDAGRFRAVGDLAQRRGRRGLVQSPGDGRFGRRQNRHHRFSDDGRGAVLGNRGDDFSAGRIGAKRSSDLRACNELYRTVNDAVAPVVTVTGMNNTFSCRRRRHIAPSGTPFGLSRGPS